MQLEGFEGFHAIGSGGNAHVFRALESATGQLVAVKVLRGGGDEAVLRRFTRERAMMADLETIDNVVPVFQSGIDPNGDPFLVMPLYTGGSLQDRVADGPMPWQEAVRLTKKLVEAIALTHAKRILHLDLKPANVLLDDDGQPWLADFGISEMMGTTASMSAAMMTPAFTAPERFSGGKPNELTDIYGLTATLYALLSGNAPFSSDEYTTPLSVMRAVVDDPLDLDALPADVPTPVRNLLLRGMAKDPASRPDSAIAMVRLFDDLLLGRDIALPADLDAETAEPISPPPVPEVQAQPEPVSVSRTEPNPVSETVDRPGALMLQDTSVNLPGQPVVESSGKNQLTLVALALGLLVVLGAGGFLALTGSDGDGESDSPQEVSTASAAEVADESGENASDDEEQAQQSSADSGEADSLDASENGEGSDASVVTDSDSSAATNSNANGGATNAAVSIDSRTTATASETRAPASNTTAEDRDEEAVVLEEIETEVGGIVLERTDDDPSVAEPRATTETVASPSNTASPSSAEPAEGAGGIEAGFVASGGPEGSEQLVSFRSITIGDASDFAWDFGDGGTGSGENVTHNYASPGTYSVTITARADGVVDSATHPVRVGANTTELEAGFIASVSAEGSEQTIRFNNITVGEAEFFSWDLGDGTTSDQQSPVHRYSAPGTYSVTITATSPTGQTDSATHSVRVDADVVEEEGQILEAGWTASAAATPNQQTVNFRSIAIGPPATHTWDFGDGTTGSGDNPSHTYAEPGEYSVTVTAVSASSTDTATHSLRVDQNG